ncbi:MAG: methyltransferase domain-containing protein, partial [Magnetococcales bacterium]|nr:methyltransferase domain-containing protein [Magnetococcales bacterium]
MSSLTPGRSPMLSPTIPPPMLNLLRCPACHGGLVAEDGEELLRCKACGHAYPIVEGIPVLFVGASHDSLGGQGKRHWDPPSQASLYDAKVEGEGEEDLFGSYVHRSETEAVVRFYRDSNLDLVLDAGCGNGRFLTTLPEGSIGIGADASLNLLLIARARRRGAFHVCCELERLPFHSGLFGTVINCRVLQHLEQQREAVAEMARVTRDGGDVIIQVYNRWNLKTLYKVIRQSRLRKLFNLPFRLIFRSMSPFADWGLAYDRYNSWPELRRWMRGAGLHRLAGRGAGFGYHKFLLEPFFLNALLSRKAPRLLEAHYRGCLGFERRFAALPPLRYLMEKFVLTGSPGEGPSRPSPVGRLVASIRHRLCSSPLCNLTAWRETREGLCPDAEIGSHRQHLLEALSWMERAHDATTDGGVSRGYGVGWKPHSARGWQPSYPETTGYIIPTLFDCAGHLGLARLRERALTMADWEIA